MIIISDTSPITSLLAVNHLHLLKDLYGLVEVVQTQSGPSRYRPTNFCLISGYCFKLRI